MPIETRYGSGRSLAKAWMAGLWLLCLWTAPAAQAATAPSCEGHVWSRPGLSRDLQIHCSNTDRVRIAEQPAHGAVSGDRFDGWMFHFRLSSDDAAPWADEFKLDLDGPAGPAQDTVTVSNVPLDTNTPPRCEPVETAMRTDGLGPAEVAYHTHCWDDEHDDFTLFGGGPGRHLDAPLKVPNGMDSLGIPSWRYRTAVTAGPELTSFWAVDSQGGRSANAPVSVMVGPAVDRLPECRPNPASWSFGSPGFPVHMRPGLTRRFTIICDDADGDDLEPRVVVPPTKGSITRFDADPPQTGWWGLERWVDVTYDPFADQEGEDLFSVLGSGSRGAGLPAVIRMIPKPLPANGGGGCGWSGGTTTPGTPVTLEATCSDDEGDRLSATIIDPPAHGTADDPVVEDWKLGYEAVRIRYTPEEGFRGIDLLTVRVADDHGLSHDLEFSVNVDDPMPPPPPVEWTPGADPEGWYWSPDGWRRKFQNAPPSVGQAAALTPAEQARRALRTRAVRLVRRLGHAAVYAPRKPLKPAARVRALAVTCAVRCHVASAAGLLGARSARRARTRVNPGRARLVTLRLSSAQRRLLRQGRPARAVFRVTARSVAGQKRTGRVRLRLRP